MVITMLMSLEMEGVCFYTYTYTNIHVRVCTSVFYLSSNKINQVANKMEISENLRKRNVLPTARESICISGNHHNIRNRFRRSSYSADTVNYLASPAVEYQGH